MHRARAPRVPGEAGIWIFVGGDLAVFTLFFVLIALGQREHPALFAHSRAALNLRLGLANTLLLLTGSWAVAGGVGHARRGRDRAARRCLLLGIACGLGFVANKAIEWSALIGAGTTPATNDFFSVYFVFTGIHLFHVLLGCAVLAIMARACEQSEPSPPRDRLIESGGVFWHLVDLLWIVLFALLYLL
jgi:nitric oxide reductase NorE protein